MGERLTERQRELVEKNHNLIYGFANRNKLSVDEYYDILAIGLCRAAKMYDANNGAFSTFAYICMKNALVNYWEQNCAKGVIPNNKIVSYDTPNFLNNVSSDNGYINCFTENDYTCDIVMSNMMYESFCSLLTETERLVVDLLIKSIPQVQIAERMGCSKQNIRYYIDRIRKKFAKHLATY